jgi:DNA replication protein DnaC
MGHHPTLDNLQALRLHGRYPALVEPRQRPEIAPRSVAERLGRLVDRARTEREDRRLPTRGRQAKLRQAAWLEARDSRQPRGWDKALMTTVATGQGMRDRHNVLITGPTGIGQTWSAGALGQQACRDGFTALSLRLPRLLQEWPRAKGDGRDVKLRAPLAKTDVLSLDDGGLATRRDENRRDWLALLEDRYDRRATIVTSQLPVEHGHEALGDPPLADAILARLGHNAYKRNLRGESMRKSHGSLTRKATSASQCLIQRRCAPRVAGFAWIRGQPARGPRGRLPVDWVAAFTWFEWQPSHGLGGRNPWNTQG